MPTERRPRAAIRVLLGGVLALLLLIGAAAVTRHSGSRAAAFGSSAAVDEASVTRAEGRQDTVAQMLLRRAAALQSKDRTAFLDTVDDVDPGFRDSQAEWFDNLSAVPFENWTFKLTNGSPGSVPRAATALATKLADGTFPYVVTVSYRVAGYDNAPQRYDQVLTFTPRHGRWLISGSFDPSGESPHRELWDVGRVQILKADHGLVLGLVPPDALRVYAAEVDREVPLVDSVWRHEWSRQVLIEVTRTEDEMATLLGGAPSSYRQLAAVTRGELGTVEATSAAERIIVNPKAFGELSEVGRRVIMGHEITHVAVRASTQSWTPRWLAEGLADYVGYRDSGLSTEVIAQELAADVRHGKLPDAMPTDDEFAATDPELAQAYELSWLACRMIAERYGGPDNLIAFYRAVGSAGSANQIDRAFAEVLSTTQQQFSAVWRDYVKSELG